MKEQQYHNLKKIFASAKSISISDHPSIVIFSDLHMGTGGRRDEFKANEVLFKRTLKEYYLEQDYSLVLNGDVEELHKYPYRKIRNHYDDIYNIFLGFQDKDQFFKIIGNHDDKIGSYMQRCQPHCLYDAVKIEGFKRELYIYHGHQAAQRYIQFNDWNEWFIKYVAKPLGIKNWAKAHDNDRQIKVEHKLYEFSLNEGIISLVGHTHRPLFESLSESDLARFFIEYNLRRYSWAHEKEKHQIADEIKRLKEYFNILTTHRGGEIQSCVYSSQIPVPCLFNSGAVLGKRGMTCLELTPDKISLVHWFDENVKKKFINMSGRTPSQPVGKGIYRLVIRERDMRYITDCIDLLR